MSGATIEVIEPGLLTTVQDLGRTGLLRFGVTTGGALDQAALTLGNRLVGNEPGDAGLELTLVGPRLRFTAPVVLALTGSDLGATLNGQPLPRWQPVRVETGDELAFSPGRAVPGAGARAYLCVAGGIAVEPVMGGRGTDLFGKFGGLEGRALKAGDRLPVGDPGAALDQLARRRLAIPPPEYGGGATLRVVLGPQRDRFTDAAVETLLSEPYRVSNNADRMGLRLSGPVLEHTRGADMISEGIHLGSIQVPGDGQPIALTRARQTVGGYPKIATIIGADLDALGQLRPGDEVRFEAVDVATARAETLAYRQRLGPEAVVDAPAGGVGRVRGAETARMKDEMAVPDNWTPAEVARLVTELERADVRYVKLEIEPVGLTFELRRGPQVDAAPGEASVKKATSSGAVAGVESSPAELGDAIVAAPMLGVFFRRPAPDQEPFAEEGQALTAGQAIGLIEVMKTYHEITVDRDCVLEEFLVEDGQFVEYGQAIARLG